MNYAYWFANITAISNRKKRELLLWAGSAEDIYFLPQERMRELCMFEPRIAQLLTEAKKVPVRTPFEKLAEKGIAFLTVEDETYPEKLRNIPDAPYAIYVKGRLPETEKKSVAIVGARMCSEYGRTIALQLGRQLAAQGIPIVSGMARGVDTAGHMGALEVNGVTCAVLGCGVDVCYPKSNQKLYEEILERGCILSEYPPGTEPHYRFFPERNRIISGLSDAVVVVEARERSGSLITADQALEQGRDVYAVPGRMQDSLSKGCNSLIRQGAGIISDIGDFVKELGISDENNYRQESFEKLLLEKDESMVYSCLDLLPKSVEGLLRETQFSMPKLAEALAKLEQKGFIAETFKNHYIRRI